MIPKRALAVLAAVALVVPLALISSPAGPASSVTFGSAIIVDPIHTFGEPDIHLSPDGNVYVSGPWGTGTQRSFWERSSDGGRSFRPLHVTPMTSTDQSDSAITGPGGGDTELSIDHNGRVFYADLAALASLKVAVWDEKTKSMQTRTFVKGKGNADGYDRQWFALWDPADQARVRKISGYTGPFPVNYLTYSEALGETDCQPTLQGCDGAAYSLDGLKYSGTTSAFVKSNDGSIVLDQDTGTVLQAMSLSDGSHNVGVAIRTRDATKPSDPALKNVRIVKVALMPTGTTTGGAVPFPVVTMDSSRTAYLVWGTRSDTTTDKNPNSWQIFYSYSLASSGWAKWSKPVKVSSPPSRSATMPWAVAGAKGRLAVVWYGTEDGTHSPSTLDVHQAWDVYLAMVTKADSATPEVRQMKVTRHPMHYGTICLQGTECLTVQGNRNLADFFEVAIDPRNGALSIVYDDTSNELIQTIPGTDMPIPPPFEGISDHRGAPVVTVMRQNGGIGMFGTPISGAAAFGSGRLYGAKGNATFDPVFGGSQVPGLDVQNTSVQGDGSDLVFRLAITSLADTAASLSTTGARALDYVVRWVGEPIASSEGQRNPIYYAAAEVTSSGSPTFFAGTARSVDLCSVSACFPHTIEYPAPPLGGTSVPGKLIHGSGGGPDYWEIHVPRNVVGGPRDTTLLESLSVFTIARNKPASLPMTNVEEELGISPVVIDALCCVDTTMAASRPVVLGSKTTQQRRSVPRTTAHNRLAATGVRSAPVWLVLALIIGAALSRRSLKRR